MIWVLKIYSHPKSPLRGFSILQSDNWDSECRTEKSLDYKTGASSMSQHDSKQAAIDHARQVLGMELFNKCF